MIFAMWVPSNHLLETLRLESVFLLFFVHDGVVHPLAVGICHFLGACTHLSVFGHHAPCGHHRLASFFGNCLDGVRINTFQYNHIGLRQTCDQIILAVESGAELKVNGFAFRVGAMECELQAVGLGFNLERTLETVLGREGISTWPDSVSRCQHYCRMPEQQG
jgi:hypothetical protein